MGDLLVTKRLIGVGGAVVFGLGLSVALSVGLSALESRDALQRCLGLAVGLGVLLAAIGWIAHRRFRIYAHGIAKRGWFRTAQIRDVDVAGFRYSATEYFLNGAPEGVVIKMRVDPIPTVRRRGIRFRASFKFGGGREFHAFRDRLAQRLAQPMIETVKRGQPCSDCQQLILTPQGIRLRPSTLLSRGDDALLPYHEIAAVQLHLGKCKFFRRNVGECGVIDQSAYNFWPAYVAVLRLSGNG